MNEKSKFFNYELKNDISFCSNIEIINSKKLNNKVNIKKLKVISQNMFGLKNPEFFTLKRIPYLADNLLKLKADIYFLQEVSSDIIKILKKYFVNYYFSSDKIDNDDDQLETLILSKIKPIEFKNFFIGGISSYNNSFSLIRFNNVILVNMYVQAGNYDSPYLENVWRKFQKCRAYNIRYIKKYIFTKYYKKCKNIILTGDFNCDINMNHLEKKVLIEDYFKTKQNNYEELLTEDTSKNFFRFNIKQKEKMKQYDGFFLHGNIISSKPQLINTKPIFYLNKREGNIFIEKLKIKFDDIKIKCIDKKIPIFPSDHFGVMCSFNILN